MGLHFCSPLSILLYSDQVIESTLVFTITYTNFNMLQNFVAYTTNIFIEKIFCFFSVLNKILLSKTIFLIPSEIYTKMIHV